MGARLGAGTGRRSVGRGPGERRSAQKPPGRPLSSGREPRRRGAPRRRSRHQERQKKREKAHRLDLPSVTAPGPSQLGKTLQRKCLALLSPVTPLKVYCCLFIAAVLTTSVVALSIVLSVLARKEKPVIESPKYAACPKSWIGFGSKCFYFSEDTRNWTFSQVFCVSLEASLAQFATVEELNFLKRYKGPSEHWIGLRRESSDRIWRWTDNTEHNNTFPIRGVGECAYLNDNGVGSASIYTDRKWICSKPNSYVYNCQIRNSLQNFPMDAS
ncbi:C-type lectin domain family 2 member E-like [Saimiri boliviensis]|uniref:C-type lectin domain family 2 member E-like n=1 Tax=Saimiri boliviensis TaxID=27679 RepID=UPI003D777225